MRKKTTKKYHRINKEGELTKETFTSVLRFCGIKINEENHSFEGDIETGENGIGFKNREE